MKENDKIRARIWALTINKNAKVYESLEEAVNTILGKNDKYAYIRHDKDINEDTGELKEEHIHLLLSFNNPRGFNSLRKTFEGAHIEKALGESSYANYLLHNGKPEKYQYSKEEVKTNDINWYSNLIVQKARETFIEDKLPYYVLVEHTDTYLKACLRFGASQLPYNEARKIEEIKIDFSHCINNEEREEVIQELKAQFESEEEKEIEELF